MVYTDHKPLTHAIARVSDPWTARQCRQLAYVAEYTSDIRHIAGSANIVADTLSRPPGHAADSAASSISPPLFPAGGRCAGNGQQTTSSLIIPGLQPPASQSAPLAAPPPGQGPVMALVPATPLPAVDWAGMAARQLTCPLVQQTRASPALHVRGVHVKGTQLLCDVSRGPTRPLVPATDRTAVFLTIHSVAHPGIRATRRLLSARFVWHGMARYINAWCRDCQTCQRGKVTKQPPAMVQNFATPCRRFAHVHLDLVGPLPRSEDGHVYVLTVIDISTRWVEAFPIKNIELPLVLSSLWLDGWHILMCLPR